MALVSEGELAGVSWDVPEGILEGSLPEHSGDAVLLQVADSTTVSVFDKRITALRLRKFMEAHGQWQVYLSDDCVAVSADTKLILAETSLVNQRLLTSYAPRYTSKGALRWLNRSSSAVLSTTDALKVAGHCLNGDLPYTGNIDLRTGNTSLRIVDWYYRQAPVDSTDGSRLEDATHIRFAS